MSQQWEAYKAAGCVRIFSTLFSLISIRISKGSLLWFESDDGLSSRGPEEVVVGSLIGFSSKSISLVWNLLLNKFIT